MAALDPRPSTPLAGGTARRPIAVVRLDGAELPAVLSVRTTNVSHNSADTFEVELPLQVQPQSASWPAWGGDDHQPEIEILYGLIDARGNRSALNSTVLGLVDSVEVLQPENRVVLSGRDYSSALIDTQSFQNFTNQTASQIATTIAQKHGLTPIVQATATPVGTKNEGDGSYSRVTRRESEWDLLTQLARNEGFVCYVRGRSLYFQPDTEPTGTSYALVWRPATVPGASPSANVTKLQLKRALTLARDIVVTVTSHDPASAVAVTASQRSTPSGQSGASSTPQTYVVDIPGLTQAQASARATQLLKSYSLFERVIDVTLPGDPFLSFEQPIALSGTGTSWDQTYFADQIERRLSLSEGFSMTIRAKNHSTGQTSLGTAGSPS